MSQHVIGGSSVAAHDRRLEQFEKDQKTWERPAGGGLLSPMPTTAPARPRRKAKPKGPKQVQVKHRWSYIVLWYEEIRRHTRTDFGTIQPIEIPVIESYARLMWIPIEPFEVDLLMKLDLTWRSSLPKEKPRPEK